MKRHNCWECNAAVLNTQVGNLEDEHNWQIKKVGGGKTVIFTKTTTIMSWEPNREK